MYDGDPDGLRPSILERLISEPSGSGAIRDIRVGVDEVRAAVRRDIEWLLNARQFLHRELEGLPEAKESVLTFGLPDLSVYSPSRAADNEELRRLITELLERFEPRLLSRKAVKRLLDNVPRDLSKREREEYVAAIRPLEVSRAESGPDHRASSVFMISGTMRVDPIFESVVFETRVEFDTGSVEVKSAE